jgi:hypothetical protein
MPVVHHKGPPDKRLSAQNRLDDRIGRAVRPLRRNKSPQRARAVVFQHTCRHAQHVALFVHALENGAEISGQTLRFVDHRHRLGFCGFLSQPGRADEHLGQRDPDGFFGELVDCFPRHRVVTEPDAARTFHDLAGDAEAAREFLLVARLTGGAEQVNAFRHLGRLAESLLLDRMPDLAPQSPLLKQQRAQNHPESDQERPDRQQRDLRADAEVCLGLFKSHEVGELLSCASDEEHPEIGVTNFSSA